MLKGMICLWYGLINAIPDGWHLCDGAEDTVDLRDAFIIGAGSTYAPGNTSLSPNHGHNDGYVAAIHNIPFGTNLGTGVGVWAFTVTAMETLTTDAAQSIPPYHALCYIQKT